jgi:phosphatidylethanolamine-binding protein (PEBP) family uncharacterized protein
MRFIGIGSIKSKKAGSNHPYVFRLYALDFKIENEPPLTAGKVLSFMEGHVIAKAAYMGTYR